MLMSCSKSHETLKVNKIVIINFSNEIKGLKVKVTWQPKFNIYQHIVGPAILEFENVKDSSKFTLVNNHFGILKNKLLNKSTFEFSKDSTKIMRVLIDNITLNYNAVKPLDDYNGFGTTSEPFFFSDIDFDNKPELILTELYNGQREVATFKAYKLEDLLNNDDRRSDRNQITYKKPFVYLDEMSSVDYINNIIKIYHSNGSGSSSQDYYQVMPPKNEYEESNVIFLHTQEGL